MLNSKEVWPRFCQHTINNITELKKNSGSFKNPSEERGSPKPDVVGSNLTKCDFMLFSDLIRLN